MEKLTEEQIRAKVKEISQKLNGAKIHAFMFEENDEDGQVIGFLREPGLTTKIRALDSMQNDKLFSTGATLLESLLVKEYSDDRILSGQPQHDAYYLGAATQALNLVRAAQDRLKKKSTSITHIS
jgi:hypothetical protein